MATPVKYRNGVIGTTIFHGLLLLFLFIMGFKSLFPPPPAKGILVDFGNSNTGMGQFEPRTSDQAPTAPREEVAPPVQNKEALMTQDVEEAPVIRTEQIQPKPQPKPQTQVTPTPKVQTATTQPVPERTVDSRALFPGRGATQSTATSEGIAGGSGNQGVTTGAPDVKVYGPGGDVGGGNTFVLSGRTLMGSLPLPNYPGQVEGVVMIEITVDGNGVVTDAQYTGRGSTAIDERLIAEARAAALKARFSRAANSPIQKGTIRYTFKLTGE